MIPKMPRGAFPVSRSDLAASEAYRPDVGAQTFIPSDFPASNHELAAAQPYRADGVAPESFLVWPIEISFWGNDKVSNSIWAEEAFAKACAEPRVFIPVDKLLLTAKECGSSNFSEFLQMHGFQMGPKTYLDGPFYSVDWTNTAALNGAIANVGPVKIGAASENFTTNPHGRVTPGTSGWAIYGLPKGQPEDHCASLCGYGTLSALVDLFERHKVKVNLPPGMPTGLCYAMFSRGSIGIIDSQSMINITGEAWVRNPTTTIKNLAG
jgi:hypothetical protein